MTVMILLLLMYGSLVAAASAAPQSESGSLRNAGDQIWSIQLKEGKVNGNSLTTLRANLDVLHASEEESVQFIVRTYQLLQTRNWLKQNDIAYNVHISDLGRFVQAEEEKDGVRRRMLRADQEESCTAKSCLRPLTQDYMTFQQIEWFLKSLAKEYPANVKLTTEGKSREGNNIYLVTVKQAAKGSKSHKKSPVRKAVFVDGGIHAREWISPATTLNILMKQTEDCVDNTDCDYDHYFMPMLNPDGYMYTWSTDRLWRKNRSPPPTGSACYGTDLNRNWNPNWGKVGSSDDPCKEIYAGTSPFSEPETVAAKKVIKSLVDNKNVDLRVYISYHSYGKLVLYPLGYTSDPAHDEKKLNTGGNIYERALRAVNGVTYTVQQSSALYPAAGASDDYTYDLNIIYSYTVELRDTSSFVLSSSNILPTYKENHAGYSALLKHAYSA